MQEEGFIYEWNSPDIPVSRPVAFCDGTLHDGLQPPSVRTPPIEKKLCILRLLKSLEIGSADIGLPDPGAHVASEVGRLATKITSQKTEIRPYCSTRTFIGDIQPIVEISQRAGIPITVANFFGASPIRQYVEGWSLDLILKHSEVATCFAGDSRLPVAFITEDTARSSRDGPQDYKKWGRGAGESCLFRRVFSRVWAGAGAGPKFLIGWKETGSLQKKP